MDYVILIIISTVFHLFFITFVIIENFNISLIILQ